MKTTTWWCRGLTAMGMLAVVSVATPAAAQRHIRDVPQDRREIRQDRTEVRSDRADVQRLSLWMARLDRAQEGRDWRRENRLRARIHAFLRDQIADARRDVSQDRREVFLSDAERGRDGNWGDRRDYRDDLSDLRDSRILYQELSRIDRQLRRIEPAARAHSWQAMRQEDRLLARLLQVTREDAAASQRELREDRQELREDQG